MTYSANNFENEFYGVGYATTTSPLARRGRWPLLEVALMWVVMAIRFGQP